MGETVQPDPANRTAARLRLFGPMGAWTVSGESILPVGRETRALLAVIALAAPRPVSRRWLAGLLWSHRPIPLARTSLRVEIHRLLEALAPAGTGLLIITRDRLSLRSGAVWSDAAEVMRATASRPSPLSLLDGELLEDLAGLDPAFDTWLRQERERLHDRARALAESILLTRNEPGSVIPAAHRLLLIDPVHEGGWRALMRAHAERGERDLAMLAFEQCGEALAGRLDAAPSRETCELAARIRDVRTFVHQPQSSRSFEIRHEPCAGKTVPAGSLDPRNWPRVGVLPPRCVGLTEEEAFLGPGLAHEITAGLSRFYRVTVTGSDAVARLAREDPDVAAMRRAFGIDYLLDGTIQRDRDKLRVSLRLLDLRADDQIIWTDRFDRAAIDLTAAQHEIAAEVVARIEPELQVIEAVRNPPRPEAQLSANDLLLLTIPPIIRMEREAFMRAGEHLERAVAQEPNFCDVHGWYAFWHVLLVSQGWAPDPRQALIRGGELAERAVALNPSAVRSLTIAGLLRSYLASDLNEAAAFYDRALELNPNLAMTWALSAVTCANMGDLDEARRRFEVYKTRLPHGRLAFVFDSFFAPIDLIRHDYQAAIVTGHALARLNPRFSACYKSHLAALGHLGHHQEAAAILRRLLTIEPNFTIRSFLSTTPMRRPNDLAHFAEGLRLAGVASGQGTIRSG
jgi:DNA-binding SARP family transcriptional activator